ncbi:MAG: threonine--tRNA ligase, partial [Candidatus Nanoarchaeia archaeon]|nr:threonine--tRNA ligase [Candidatus Nanoarchaeia archaeon]
MKILTIHSDYIKFEPTKKALKSAEDVEMKQEEMKDCLVVFSAVEKADESNLNEIVDKYIDEIKKVAEQVKAKRIVLYPYAHLSNTLSNPAFAVDVLKEAQKKLSKEFEVIRAPFGWYKKFEISCKGHPLSELSREFGNAKDAKSELKEEACDPKKLLSEITKIRLDTSKLKENDHRILGQKLDLFSFNEVAPGMVFWHSNGLIIFNELVNLWRHERSKAGYKEISTPQIMNKILWQISGHWDLYKENNFVTSYEGTPFLIKPMSCPGGMLVYKNKPKSYKDLPLRASELGKVHRVELSGTLGGLFRVIQFTQDDAHIFCTENQLEKEITETIKLFNDVLKRFGFTELKFSLSIRNEEKKDKYIGTEESWKLATESLANAMKILGLKFNYSPGEAKFYGPSLDVMIKDSQGREWQCSTLQVDFNLPKRFELEYIGEDNKPHTPIMLHNVIYGSVERFLGVLLEHTNGNLPTWLSPIQARVIPFKEDNYKSANKLLEELKQSGIRADIDLDNGTINNKIRNAELMKIPYILVLG